MNANNKVCCGFCDNNLGNEVGHTMDNYEVWCDDCYEDKTEQCDDCTELFRQGTLIQVVKLDGTVLDYCAHCHSMPRCPDCDDQLSKHQDFECDCGWFDKSRVWVCGHCGDTISNDITKCGCPNSEDSDDDDDDDTPPTIIDCSVCKRCIDMDKDAFHNIERIAPDADGNVPVMNLCTYCWDDDGDYMLNNGWTNNP